MSQSKAGDIPPVHQIDMSLPPSSRYVALAKQYQSQLRRLMPLFDCLLEDARVPVWLFPLTKWLAQLFLRRVHSSEENLELQGISRVTQVPMYLLVSFNVVLDLLMGCTSGAARTLVKGHPISNSKMLHFRTLDWGMDPLRDVVVQLEFVDGASHTPGKVLATTITYVGFVGVLTGVRRGLSMSLNFRPQHDSITRMDHIYYYAHNLLVLLGMRQSISSLLRSCLISDFQGTLDEAVSLDHLAESFPSKGSTAAYLIYSDGHSAMTIEKDRISGKISRSNTFIVMTNHDLEPTIGTGSTKNPNKMSSLEGILAESVDRRACMLEKWTKRLRKEQAKRIKDAEKVTALLDPTTFTTRQLHTRRIRLKDAPKAPRELGDATVDGDDIGENVCVTVSELRRWLTAWPTTNECTHFSAILDPTEGKVVWAQRYLIPVKPPRSRPARSSIAAKMNGE